MCRPRKLHSSEYFLRISASEGILSLNGVPMLPENERPMFPAKLWDITGKKEVEEVPGRTSEETEGLPGARDLGPELNDVDCSCEATTPQEKTRSKGVGSGGNENEIASGTARPPFEGRSATRVLFGSVGPPRESVDMFLTNTEQQVRKLIEV
jgi:hypothetical protein